MLVSKEGDLSHKRWLILYPTRLAMLIVKYGSSVHLSFLSSNVSGNESGWNINLIFVSFWKIIQNLHIGASHHNVAAICSSSVKACKMIIRQKSFAAQAVMAFLTVKIMLVSLIGNGLFLAIFARFKVFRRSFSNILFANLALVDLLKTLVNLPLFAVSFILEPSSLKGKTWAIISASLHVEFAFLNIVSMSALMLDRFLALQLELRYFTWKTTKKAKIAVFLIWLLCTTTVTLSAVPLLDMDQLEGVPLNEARGMILEERILVSAPLTAFFTIASTVLGFLSVFAINQKKKEVKDCH